MRYAFNWKFLFELAALEDLDKPLTVKILSDPSHKIVQLILYIYSMESFIYQDLNRATRDKDKSRIKFYGAFAAALSFILYSATKNRADLKVPKVMNLYRGIKLSVLEVEDYKPGSKINLPGYTSTSKDIDVAIYFAFKYLKEDQVPVILSIKFKGNSGLFELTKSYSAYPSEGEVLL